MTDVRISLRDEGAELFLLGNAIVESEALVPDAVENAAAGSRQKETVFGIAVRRFHSVIRVRDADRIMDMNIKGGYIAQCSGELLTISWNYQTMEEFIDATL